MRRMAVGVRVLLIWVALAVSGAGPAAAETATVAVAANFAQALQAISEELQQRTGHRFVLVSGSSGKLAAQVIHGAPYDMLLAADQERPQRLVDEGLADNSDLFTYTRGSLVLWSKARPLSGTADVVPTLAGGDYRRLAIANPELAPYGQAAREVLERAGVWDTVQGKLIYGENVQQAYAFAVSGAADLALVALATAKAGGRGHYVAVPENLYRVILQDGVVLKRGRDNRAARALVRFLHGDEAKQIMARYGFTDIAGGE